jgi:drug/metabolite transporter (DMT)-like permease
VLISFLAFSASIAIGMMIKAYQISEASYTVVYEYFYLISAGFFGYILWDSIPNLYGIIGIILIIIAGVIISILKPNKVRSYS